MDGIALWSNKSRDRVNSALQHPDRALSVVRGCKSALITAGIHRNWGQKVK